MNAPTLIYCADGNPRFAALAVQHGFRYGAQLPNHAPLPVYFTDQNWKDPNREQYMKALAEHRPALATVLDLEHEHQFDEVMAWADEAAKYVTEAVIIIPKVFSIIPRIPEIVGGKPVRLGYSVPTRYGATQVPVWEFGARPVHLLGGSPPKQIELSRYLNAVSADGNTATSMAIQYGKHYIPYGHHWQRIVGVPRGKNSDAPYLAFALSCINIRAAWRGATAYVRFAVESDLTAVKRIASQHKNELGFVMLPSLRAAVEKRELYVAEYRGEIVGFCNWHRRRDGVSTIYEIAVDRSWRGRKVGASLLSAVPAPVRLKCTVDNPANEFYAHEGMQLIGTEAGKKRALNVWRLGA